MIKAEQLQVLLAHSLFVFTLNELSQATHLSHHGKIPSPNESFHYVCPPFDVVGSLLSHPAQTSISVDGHTSNDKFSRREVCFST